ncbi:putative binding protein component of ABC iron transporter [Desulfosarcina alkanivorans]|uniref:Putative binding protein component of ABC iron transporter n=1 Tax=Desulfosarcina alkanivorans TaxID=571177 RepID=A0A5K7YM77_9BACT|nr:extracellular solute-binding protein [Desulfosarcina alkanivorans]BBO69928.1 putative binding protein component of ABC iron transporter [Desulfosarcina alkanivorans]
MNKRNRTVISIFFLIGIIAYAGTAFSQELVVYSARKEHLIKPVFNRYTKETGVKIKYITDKAPVLLQRIKAEGKNTPADLLITVDAGNLWHAAKEHVLQPVDSEVLAANIPSHLRDPDNRWFGLSIRARTIVYSTDRVKAGELATYEDLANPDWKDRLVLRTSKKVYNQSLVAMLIKEHGETRTSEILRGWVNNLAAPPFSNDTKTMEAIIAGQGDVGIVNTYYFGRLTKKDPTIPIALYWPNQSTGGVHVNVSGAGIVAASRNKPQAVAFLEWLSTESAQQIFADVNMEYPVNPNVPVNPTVASWGSFKQNQINLANAGENQATAIQLMDRAGYN